MNNLERIQEDNLFQIYMQHLMEIVLEMEQNQHQEKENKEEVVHDIIPNTNLIRINSFFVFLSNYYIGYHLNCSINYLTTLSYLFLFDLQRISLISFILLTNNFFIRKKITLNWISNFINTKIYIFSIV